jgi:hypothetical protein
MPTTATRASSLKVFTTGNVLMGVNYSPIACLSYRWRIGRRDNMCRSSPFRLSKSAPQEQPRGQVFMRVVPSDELCASVHQRRDIKL